MKQTEQQRHHKYYEKYKEIIKAKRKEYRKTHSKQISDRKKEYRKKHPESKKYDHRYYLKHRLHILERIRKYDTKRYRTHEYRIKRNQKYRIGTKKTISGITDFIKELYYFKREVLNAAS